MSCPRAVGTSERPSDAAREVLRTAGHEVALGTASLGEIAIEVSRGRLDPAVGWRRTGRRRSAGAERTWAPAGRRSSPFVAGASWPRPDTIAIHSTLGSFDPPTIC